MRFKPADRPTLLVFTLGAEAERARRGLLPESLRDAELAIHRRCVERSVRAGLAAGCRVVISSPRPIELGIDGASYLPQRGSGFGERLRYAVSRVSEQLDGGPLVLIGTDSPALSSVEIAAALRSLRESPDKVVVGPARDGGFYLLAAHGPFEPQLGDVSWCCSETASTLIEAFASGGRSVEMLDPLDDLDHPADLVRWLKSRFSASDPWREIVAFVKRQLDLLSRPAIPARLGGELVFATAPVRGRAPPR